MRKSVSIPEKTLEHWSSQYLTYRYLSKAALWWPARGEDIRVGWLPTRPGKIVQLELKTTTVVSPTLHDVKIDLGQLWDYRQKPVGLQPFYVFPKPDWGGTLEDEAIADGRAVTELAFARSGSGWWFAHWMVVLTAAEVAAVLHRELAAHGSGKRGAPPKNLVQFTVDPARRKTTCKWGPSKKSNGPKVIGLLDFLSEFEQCGRAGWPQLIRLPERFVRENRGPYSPEQVAAALRDVASRFAPREWDTNERLVTLEPGEDGNYQVTQTLDDYFIGTRQRATAADAVDESEDHRQVFFLDAWALRQREAGAAMRTTYESV